MLEAPPQLTTPAQAEHKPHWWWHDDDYAAQGKVSKLAIFEIFLAVGFYYYLLPKFFSFPWVTVVAFLAVPLLLLRSQKSVDHGLELLLKSLADPKLFKLAMWIFGVISFVLCMVLIYQLLIYLAQHWLKEHTGWPYFWRSAVMAAGLAVLAFIVIGASDDSYGDGAMIFLGGYVLGIYIYTVLIRLRATVVHLGAGFVNFSRNWSEALMVSNMRHAPALIPGGGHQNFNIKTMPKPKDLYDSVWWGLLKTVMFLGAIIYRWNIKANGLLLAPAAMGFSENVWLPDPEAPEAPPESKRKHTARMANRIALGALFTICLCVLGYVALSWMTVFQATELSKTLTSWLPNWLLAIYNFSTYLPIGARLVLATLGLLSLLWLIWCTYCMLSDYPKEVSEPVAYSTMQPHVKKGFDAAAERIASWRKRTQMVCVFLAYAFFIKFAVQQWPAVWGKIISKSFVELL